MVVGFSGGGDSLALAAVLLRVASLQGVGVTLIHVDHRLRPESAQEAEQAERLAEALGMPIQIVRVPFDRQSESRGIGIEEAARRMRYVALANAAKEHGTETVALAHHQDDQAETVLLHLLRGAGVGGAAAMAESASLTVPWWSSPGPSKTIHLWRPLLSESQAILREYVASLGLTPVSDPSNADRRFTRNRLRHEVLPVLQSINPNASAVLARFARIAAEEDAALDAIAFDTLRQFVSTDRSFARRDLLRQPIAVRRRMIRLWLRGLGLVAELPFERVEAVLDLVDHGRGGAKVELGSNWSVTVEHGILRARDSLAEASEKETSSTGVDLTVEE